MSVKVQWATPDADKQVLYMARVSNPDNQESSDTRLLNYCMEHGHVSPFEMANACLMIETTRDIGRQILRHRSFSFQEFCVAGATKITLELPSAQKHGRRGAYTRTIEHLYSLQQRKRKLPSLVRVFDERTRTFVTTKIREVFQTGAKPIFRITLANGRFVECTKEHKFLTNGGFLSIEDAVGLRLVGNTAAMAKRGVEIACNGEPAYRDAAWLAEAKRRCIASGAGLTGIALEAGVTSHTIRKALKRHGLQFTSLEVAAYNPIWNKGLSGYSRAPHSPETIEKMRAKARRGAASNLWRGGADRLERLKIADWCRANRAYFMRAANYRCVRCQTGEKLEMHHIQTVAARPDLAYERTNIEILCNKCHREHHGTNGDAKLWRERSRGNALTVHWSPVAKVEYLGEQMTYDMEVEHASHNYVANGIVTHNSQRYQSVDKLPAPELRECRLQDTKNRQNSVAVEPDSPHHEAWTQDQRAVWALALETYRYALQRGVAKEQARAVLPEGLTPSRLYMNGTLRSWIHYLQQRLDPTTQHEHRVVAARALVCLRTVAPSTFEAFFPWGGKV